VARSGRPLDVLLVSIGSTAGLRRADEELRDSLVRAGATAAIARALAPSPKRTLMLTDLAWARAARAAALQALAEHGLPPRAIVYSSTTAALLWPRRGVIRFDAATAGNRPGRHGLWQRPLERRRLSQAPLLLPWSEGAVREALSGVRDARRSLVIPMPVEPSGPTRTANERDITAITYAANPHKKGFDRVLAAWRAVCGRLPPGAPRELVVAGVTERELRAAGCELEGLPCVRVVGALPGSEYRALVRRARVFVCAPRREDYGISQLEALADGCLLASTPAPGPYAALALARSLDPRLVSEDLEGALLAALLLEQPDAYAQRALAALAPFRRAAVDRLVASAMLPRVLDGERD
jgi:hypothetical protein